MPTVSYAGQAVTVDEDGFFATPSQWTEDMAQEVAATAGLAALSDAHWQIIKIMRTEYKTQGTGPSVRALARISGVPVKELYRLFPKGPAKLAARIAGIPRPHGCI